MSGIVKITICESTSELEELLKQRQYQEVKERIQTLYWLKTKQVKTLTQIASMLDKDRTTVSRWLSRYRKGGLKKLLWKGKSSGRTRKITPEVEQKIKRELEQPEGFSSYKEVQRWLEIVEDVKMSYSGVHKIVRYRLKGKLKVPRPVHIRQEPDAIAKFKKNSLSKF